MDDGLINTFCACLSNTFFIVKHAKRKIKRGFLLGSAEPGYRVFFGFTSNSIIFLSTLKLNSLMFAHTLFSIQVIKVLLLLA